MNKTQKGFGLVESLLVIIALSLVVFVGYYVWNTQKNVDKTSKDAVTASQTNPATNSTSSTKNSSAETVPVVNAITAYCKSISSSVNESSLKTALLKEYTASDGDQFLTISGDYARASITCNENGPGGAAAFLKKEDGSWKVMFAGQQAPTCEKVDGQGWPSNILAQCIDASAESLRAPK